MEDDLKYYRNFWGLNGRQPQFFVNKIIMQPETFKIKTMVVTPLRVTLFSNISQCLSMDLMVKLLLNVKRF